MSCFENPRTCLLGSPWCRMDPGVSMVASELGPVGVASSVDGGGGPDPPGPSRYEGSGIASGAG